VTGKRTYEQMLEEVETIMESLQAGDTDVDKVVSKVERGFEVLSELRTKLDKMTLKINKIREDFHKIPPTASS